MSERNLFDEAARVLAMPIPRRKAFKYVTAGLGGAVLSLLWPQRATAFYLYRCIVSGGVLTGDCLFFCPLKVCCQGRSSHCPPGQKAKKPFRESCPGFFGYVDLSTSC